MRLKLHEVLEFTAEGGDVRITWHPEYGDTSHHRHFTRAEAELIAQWLFLAISEKASDDV